MLLKLHVHSIIDVITNSSTEIFTLTRGSTYDQVHAMLTSLWGLYAAMCVSVGQSPPSGTVDSIFCIQDDGGIITIRADDYEIPMGFDLILENLLNAERHHY